MIGTIDATGDIVDGALPVQAVRPGDATAGGHRGHCLNCGTALVGLHCHRCGQAAHVHRTVGAIGHEIAHGVFHVEGRVWRTLPMLLRRPGRLTRRYIDGERARFVSPLALFLFVTFLLFATLGWVGVDPARISETIEHARRQTNVANQRAAISREIAGQQRARAEAIAAGQPTAPLDRRLRTLVATQAALGPPVPGQAVGTRLDDRKVITEATLAQIHTGWARLDTGLRRANDNPDLALYKLQSSAYKYSWLLIPLSTPFVALLFLWRRRFGLYDHAVFVTYSLCFMLLLTSATLILGAIGVPAALLAGLIVFAPPIHLFAQLRGTYALGWAGATWRTAVLLGFAFTALLLFAMLLIAHGLTE